MTGKILKSGNEFVLRYKSKDIGELRTLANTILVNFGIDFVEGP